jgi:myo-inositol-1(or 4)-monophosphatase
LPGPETDLALLIDAAHTAGEIARAHFGADPEIWTKSDDSPVTEADIAIDRVLRTDLRAARPDYGWLSEETEDDAERLSAQRSFVVDPIDGTRAFIEGQTSFAHSLAVVDGGDVVAGVVYLPMEDKLYAAAKGHGATLNDAPIRVSETNDLEQASALVTRPNIQPFHWKGGVPPFRRAYRPSIAYRLALVAEGRFDLMLTFRDTWEWDIAAGAILIAEAGGTVSDADGGRIAFNARSPMARGIVAAPGPLHRSLMRYRLGG